MKTLYLCIIGFYIGYYILGPNINPKISEKDIKIRQLQYSKDSIINYYEDISNCIRKDFGIDTIKKVMYYQVNNRIKKHK